MDFESLKKAHHASVKKSALWKYKNAFQTTNLRRKLEKQLESDIISLFETSQFVDLKLESPEGCIYSHKIIVASRFPSCWRLFADIETIQFQTVFERKKSCGILSIWLPSVSLKELRDFIRSLYTNDVNEAFGIALTALLQNHLINLQQNLLSTQVLYLEKLNCEEEKTVGQILLQQLRKGEISKEKGNLRDVSHLVPSKIPRKTTKRSWFLSKEGDRREGECSLISSFYNAHPSRIPICNEQQPYCRELPCSRTYKCSVPSATSYEGSFSNSKEASDERPSSKCSKISVIQDRGSISHIAHGLQPPQRHTSSDSIFESVENNSFVPCQKRFSTLYPETDSFSYLNFNPLSNPAAMSSHFAGSEVRKMEGLEIALSSKPNGSGSIEHAPSSQTTEILSDRENGEKDSIQSQSPLLEEDIVSDSDPNGLHETSSLEVELPSSQEDESLSPDFVKPEESLKDQKKVEELNYENENHSEASVPIPHRPLVRTRTFDLIEPTCSVMCAQTEEVDDKDECSQKEGSDKESERHECPPSTVTFEASGPNANTEPPPNEEDPETLRELEKKKGSLLFEHNFQTFSNIPSTNMMNVGMGSEESIGLGSLYNNMMDSGMRRSLHVPCPNKSHTPDSSLLSLSLPEMEQFLNSNPLMVRGPEMNPRGGIPCTFSQTESPSPDSLCVDSQPGTADVDPNSLSKEDFNFEEKEKDEREGALNLSPECDIFPAMTGEKPKQSASENPKGTCKEDSKPIVSGGSTLRKDSIKTQREESHLPQTVRQISSGSVKDIDAIPLVCGYVSPEREESNANNSLQQDPQNSQSQSMFSMFINLNEIPSPSVEPPPNLSKPKPPPSGGMFMFIEADPVSSPKTRRKPKLSESENKNVSTSKESHAEVACTHSTSSSNSPAQGKGKELPKIQKEEKDKKGFFVFIEAENLSKGNSPKPKRRPLHPPKVTKPESNVMSKSAPSDCLRFGKDDSSKSSGTESSMKLMTKSVIDREEFMAQPYTRRNVSLNDKINESSKIPRPVSNFKEKLSLECFKGKKKTRNQFLTNKDVSNLKKSKAPDLHGAQSLEGSLSEAATSMSVSLTESSIPTDAEDVSEFSDVSSLLSSIDRSNEPSGDDGKGPHKTLGDDLLKMLVEEINTDVTIQIGEKKIKAHKCILASRCVYFAAMLSGHWVETAGNVIKLQGFSAEAVMIALKHIYSGSSTIPEEVKISELAALADMLALDGLKEVVAQHLRANLCHYFHKPCSECVNGVLEVFPLAGAFCLEDLYHKCLKWIAKHFVVTAPTKNFASLPAELQERVLKQIMDDMSISNVIETCLGAERILNLLPVVRWAQPVFDLSAQLLESATNFIATNLSAVFMSERFLDLGRDGGWNVDSLSDTLKMAAEMVRPDQAVLSHIQLTKLSDSKQVESYGEFTESFLAMVGKLLKQIEKFMIHNANRVAVCRSWPLLAPETQKRIKDAAMVVVEFSKPLGPRPKLSSASRVRSRNSSIEPAHRLRTRSMTDHRLSRSASANVVPAKSVTGVDAKRLQPTARCHTPPPSALRVSLHTPPPTRASTLRAQARQAAIQRSQSSRTVGEKAKVSRTVFHDLSVEKDSSSHSGGPRSGAVNGFPRARTSSHGSFHTHSSTSRSSTPGLSDRPKHHKRNSSSSQLLTFNRNFCAEDDVSQKEVAEKHVTATTKSPRSYSIGASPLHHLSSLRENLSGDQRKPPVTCRAKGRAALGRRLRSPLRENHRVSSPQTNYTSAKGDSCLPRKGDAVKVPETVGLGSRSNTFCKDDKPPLGSQVSGE